MLSKKAKYAINALTHMARHYGEGPILISDIAEQEHIPRKFLEAILLDLRKNGILASKMGKGGGYYLIKSPAEVNLADVIRIFDGAIAMVPCATYKFYQPCEECTDPEACGIRAVFKEIRDVTVQVLKERTLEQILVEEKKLQRKKPKKK
jgi:Rrf2 family protein